MHQRPLIHQITANDIGGWAQTVRTRPLVLTDRLRIFRHAGRDYAHASAVPLSYLATNPALFAALQQFAQPARAVEVMGDNLNPRVAEFLATLLNVGILQDAANPDPVHSLRPRTQAIATLMLYPTNSCNLRCVYCYATSGPGAGPRLSREHALLAVADFFHTLNPNVQKVALRFHGGGEPTTNFAVMRAAWEEFRSQAQERGLSASAHTITNGTFGPGVLHTLRQPGWSVLVSYDGPRQGVQRPTAASRDSRARVRANLRALSASGKQVTVRATLTREGLPSLRELIDDAAELGVSRVQVEAASIVGRGANLLDGPPTPLAFAEAFLAEFRYALSVGVALHTSAWSHTRVGDGRYCGAITGMRALTPDGFVSACTEACDGALADDPFIVGRLDTERQRLEIWPVREDALGQRVGYHLPHCASCYMVDTCGGGCASKSRAATGDFRHRDEQHCVASRRINAELMADLADGRLLPDAGWQPIVAELSAEASEPTGYAGRLVALVPPFARSRWNATATRRPWLPATPADPTFFHLPSAATSEPTLPSAAGS